jgi:hypothetical protein
MFLRLTVSDGSYILLNSDHIIGIQPISNAAVCIAYLTGVGAASNKTTVKVTETIEQISELLNALMSSLRRALSAFAAGNCDIILSPKVLQRGVA